MPDIAPHNDLQGWNTVSIEGKLVPNLSMGLTNEMRWGDFVSKLIYSQTDLFFNWKAKPWLVTGAGFSEVYEKQGEDDEVHANWRMERRPFIQSSFSASPFDAPISNRVKLEYRAIEGVADNIRLRNRFELGSPWKWTQYEITPYVADELFMDLTNKSFARNRFYAGARALFPASKDGQKLKTELYFLKQNTNKGTFWTDYNIVGTRFTFLF